MGLLNIFRAKDGDARTVLPAGSFTIDRNGKIIASTITSLFPEDNLKEISTAVIGSFANARNAGLALTELTIRLGAMNIRAVEMRGGAMIFLSPR